jgi:hypothetical protein
MSGSAQVQAAAVQRGNPLLTNDRREGCVHILQDRSNYLRDLRNVSVGANTVRQRSYDLAALFA